MHCLTELNSVLLSYIFRQALLLMTKQARNTTVCNECSLYIYLLRFGGTPNMTLWNTLVPKYGVYFETQLFGFCHYCTFPRAHLA